MAEKDDMSMNTIKKIAFGALAAALGYGVYRYLNKGKGKPTLEELNVKADPTDTFFVDAGHTFTPL